MDIYTLGEKPIQGAISTPFIQTKKLQFNCDDIDADILIITSQKTINFMKENNCQYKDKIVYVLGESSKKIALSNGIKNVILVPNIGIEDLIFKIKNELIDKKVIYLRAKKVIFNIKEKIEKICDYKEIIVYETILINPKKQIKKNSIIIFTSPSTIESFSKIYKLEDFNIVVIGKSTASKLPENTKYYISDSPSLEMCIKKAKEITTQI